MPNKFVESITISEIKKVQIEARKDPEVISLAQGIPYLKTPQKISKSAIKSIKKHLVDWYKDPKGIDELRRQIAKYHLGKDKISYDYENEIIVTCGALEGLTVSLLSLLNKGDEVLSFTPSYVPFLNLPQVLGFKIKQVPLEKGTWSFNKDTFLKSISKGTKGLILCNPNNPSGNVLEEDEFNFICETCKNKGIYIFLDEVYRNFLYKNEKKYSYEKYKNILIRLYSFSKSYSMSGWRVGYLLASKENCEQIVKVHDMVTTSAASLPAQYGAIKALKNPQLAKQVFKKILKNRKHLIKHQNKVNDLTITIPDGAYYSFCKIKTGESDVDYCKRMMVEKKVALVPGSAFGEDLSSYIRMAFCVDPKLFKKALERLS